MQRPASNEADATDPAPGVRSSRLRPRLTALAIALIAFPLLLAGATIATSAGLQQALVDRAARRAPGAVGPVRDERYRWRPVAIGGGGFLTGMSFDARGQTWVVRSDVYGAYRWDTAQERWLQMVSAETMPPAYVGQDGMAEGVYAIAVAPSDGRRVYMVAGGRLFRSDDGGRHFVEPQSGKPFPFALDANGPFRTGGAYLAVSPADASLVLLGTTQQGLWRSADAGRTWRRVPAVPASAEALSKPGPQTHGVAIWFAPAGRGTLRTIVAAPGHGLFAGDGAGQRFRPIPGGPRSITRGSALPDGTFWAVDGVGRHVWSWRDGRWRDLTAAGQLPERSWADVVAAPDSSTVIAVDAGARFWCSADGGVRWSVLKRRYRAGADEPPWLNRIDIGYVATAQIAFDPRDATHLVTAMGEGVFDGRLPRGCTGPLEWTSRVRGIEEIVANDVVAPPGGAPLFAGWDFGIHRKPDPDAYSDTWGPKPRILISAQQVDFSQRTPSFLVTNASDTRLSCCSEDGDAVLAGYSVDGGVTWEKFATLPTPPGSRADDPWRMSFGSIAVAADDVDNIVWAPAFDRSPFYTRDRGRSWRRVVLAGEKGPLTGSFPTYFPQRKTLAADRASPGTFYLFHGGGGANASLAGMWRSTDHAATWRHVFSGEVAPNTGFAVKLRAVPGHAGHLFFTNGVRQGDTRLRRSIDGGATWTAMDRLTRVDDIGFGKAAAGARYPAIYVAGRLDGRFGVWRSVDGGDRWQAVAGLPLGRLDQVVALSGDPNRFGRVYLGYKGSGWVYGQPAAVDACRQVPGREQCVDVRGF